MSPLAALSLVLLGGALLWSARLLHAGKRFVAGDPLELGLRVAGVCLAALGCGLFLVNSLVLALPLLAVFAATLLMTAASLRRHQRQALARVLAQSLEREIPLPEAARAFAEEEGGEAGARAARLADCLEAGLPPWQALAKSGNRLEGDERLAFEMHAVFGGLADEPRRAGERREAWTRELGPLLARLAYMLFLVSAWQLITLRVLIEVGPIFVELFADFERELPWLAQTLFASPRLSSTLVMLFYAPLALALAAGVFGLLSYVGVPLRDFWPLNHLWLQSEHAEVLHWLAAAVRRGLPLPRMLLELRRRFPNQVARRRLARVLERLEAGAPWTAALREQRVARPGETALLEAAERAGNLAWALEELADARRRRGLARLRGGLRGAAVALTLVVGFGALLLGAAMLGALAEMALGLAP